MDHSFCLGIVEDLVNILCKFNDQPNAVKTEEANNESSHLIHLLYDLFDSGVVLIHSDVDHLEIEPEDDEDGVADKI